MGYSETQRKELEETINRTPCDLVVLATPVDLRRILHLNKPSVRVGYEVEELTKPNLTDLLSDFTTQHQRKPEVAMAH
jgi:predicted GTPase